MKNPNPEEIILTDPNEIDTLINMAAGTNLIEMTKIKNCELKPRRHFN
jgi:hypothetical protein